MLSTQAAWARGVSEDWAAPEWAQGKGPPLGSQTRVVQTRTMACVAWASEALDPALGLLLSLTGASWRGMES